MRSMDNTTASTTPATTAARPGPVDDLLDTWLASPGWGPNRNADGTYTYAFVVGPDEADTWRADPQALADAAARAAADLEADTADLAPTGPATAQVLVTPAGMVSIVATRNCLASPRAAEAVSVLRGAIELARARVEAPATVAALLDRVKTTAADCGLIVGPSLLAEAEAIANGAS